MTLIDADKFLAYLIFSKHIDSLTCGEVKEAIEMCKSDVLDKIRAEIEQIADEEQKHDEKWAIGLRYAVKIIDKAAESEEYNNRLEDLPKRVENIERQMKEEKEEKLKKLQAELDFAKFSCALPSIMDMMTYN